MSRGPRPSCVGLYGTEDDCDICPWKQECERMTESIESSAYRKGTHVRIVSKYKEKKYKPKKVP